MCLLPCLNDDVHLMNKQRNYAADCPPTSSLSSVPSSVTCYCLFQRFCIPLPYHHSTRHTSLALASRMRPTEFPAEVYLLIGQLQQKVADLSAQVQDCQLVCRRCQCTSQATQHGSTGQRNTAATQHAGHPPQQLHADTPAFVPATSLPSQPLTTGVVKWFSTTRGYGFVTRQDTGNDVFCHYKAISKPNPGHQ